MLNNKSCMIENVAKQLNEERKKTALKLNLNETYNLFYFPLKQATRDTDLRYTYTYIQNV